MGGNQRWPINGELEDIFPYIIKLGEGFHFQSVNNYALHKQKKEKHSLKDYHYFHIIISKLVPTS